MNRVPNQLGRYGSKLVTGTVAQSGTVWCAIQMVSATVFATLTCSDMSRSGTLASASFPADMIIYGGFTDFTLTSGTVIAYKAGANQ